MPNEKGVVKSAVDAFLEGLGSIVDFIAPDPLIPGVQPLNLGNIIPGESEGELTSALMKGSPDPQDAAVLGALAETILREFPDDLIQILGGKGVGLAASALPPDLIKKLLKGLPKAGNVIEAGDVFSRINKANRVFEGAGGTVEQFPSEALDLSFNRQQVLDSLSSDDIEFLAELSPNEARDFIDNLAREHFNPSSKKEESLSEAMKRIDLEDGVVPSMGDEAIDKLLDEPLPDPRTPEDIEEDILDLIDKISPDISEAHDISSLDDIQTLIESGVISSEDANKLLNELSPEEIDIWNRMLEEQNMITSAQEILNMLESDEIPRLDLIRELKSLLDKVDVDGISKFLDPKD